MQKCQWSSLRRNKEEEEEEEGANHVNACENPLARNGPEPPIAVSHRVMCGFRFSKIEMSNRKNRNDYSRCNGQCERAREINIFFFIIFVSFGSHGNLSAQLLCVCSVQPNLLRRTQFAFLCSFVSCCVATSSLHARQRTRRAFLIL